jgi:hypothetical protein
MNAWVRTKVKLIKHLDYNNISTTSLISVSFGSVWSFVFSSFVGRGLENRKTAHKGVIDGHQGS